MFDSLTRLYLYCSRMHPYRNGFTTTSKSTLMKTPTKSYSESSAAPSCGLISIPIRASMVSRWPICHNTLSRLRSLDRPLEDTT